MSHESSLAPELVFNTTMLSVEQAVQQILGLLMAKGFDGFFVPDYR